MPGTATTSAEAWALIDPKGRIIGDTVDDSRSEAFEKAMRHFNRFMWKTRVWGKTLAVVSPGPKRVSWQARKKCEDAVWAAAARKGFTIEPVRVSRVSRKRKTG